MNSDRSNNLSLKYQRFTPSDREGIGIRKFEFVAKTQFLYECAILKRLSLFHEYCKIR